MLATVRINESQKHTQTEMRFGSPQSATCTHSGRSGRRVLCSIHSPPLPASVDSSFSVRLIPRTLNDESALFLLLRLSYLRFLGVQQLGNLRRKNLSIFAVLRAAGDHLDYFAALVDQDVGRHGLGIEGFPEIALGIGQPQKMDILLLDIGFQRGRLFAEDGQSLEALGIIGGLEFLKVGQLRVAAGAGTC